MCIILIFIRRVKTLHFEMREKAKQKGSFHLLLLSLCINGEQNEDSWNQEDTKKISESKNGFQCYFKVLLSQCSFLLKPIHCWNQTRRRILKYNPKELGITCRYEFIHVIWVNMFVICSKGVVNMNWIRKILLQWLVT